MRTERAITIAQQICWRFSLRPSSFSLFHCVANTDFPLSFSSFFSRVGFSRECVLKIISDSIARVVSRDMHNTDHVVWHCYVRFTYFTM